MHRRHAFAINLPPTADPGGPYTGEEGVAVSFNGSVSSDPDGTIDWYDWDFGDGTMLNDAGAKPSHTYATADNYVVTLTVTDDGDKQDTQTTQAVIGMGNQPPTCDAGGPYAGAVDVPVQFEGAGSSDADGTIARYDWEFGDDGTDTRLNPTHTYTAPGPYTATLTVTDDDGDADQCTATVIIGDGLQLPPTADADGPYLGQVGTPVTFDGTASSDPDGTITDYDWDFGDGTGTGPMPENAYGAGGIYNVTLQVTDDDDLTVSGSSTALIGDLSLPPTADANGPYRGRVGAAVTFDGTASDDPDGTIARYDWDFGDGDTAPDGGPTPSHGYVEDGRYLVKLTVTDDSGETGTDTTVATIGFGNLPPQADAGDSVEGRVWRGLTFDGTASRDRDGIITDYAWDFGDGTRGTGPTPTHVYDAPGAYLVALTVTDDDDAEASDRTVAAVEPIGDFGKVTICHKGKKRISVSVKALPAHRRHGDTLGECEDRTSMGCKIGVEKACEVQQKGQRYKGPKKN
jgi:PKD repeat protein